MDYLKKYNILGTLGDNEGYLTCSMHIAKELNNADTIKPYPYFEAAATDLKLGNISCLLVPGAYPNINNFIMDSELMVSETFIKEIPALVLCGMQKQCSSNINLIFHHPATTYLLKEIDVSYQENITVSSNPEACRMILKNPDSSIALTNQLCADFYQLETYKILRAGIQMPWICFINNSEGIKNII